jgi:hypothetical protein
MLFLLFFLLQFAFFFLSNVAALNITVQPDTIVGLPSLVLWSRQPSDGNDLLVFDLRFVKPDGDDIGLALANIQAPPSTQFGTQEVIFQSPGSYLLVAVSGPAYTRIGQSAQVNAYQVSPTSIPTSTFKPAASATTSATSSSTSTTSSAKPTPTLPVVCNKKNLGAIIGGTLGGVAFLGLLAALGIIFLRRRRQLRTTTTTEDDSDDNNNTRRRWTFHRDKMILPPVLDIRRTTPMTTEFLTPDDIERQQVGLSPHDDDSTTPTAAAASSSTSPGPRPLLFKSSKNRPLPLPPSVVTLPPLPPLPPQQEDLVVQMEQMRNKITELEKREGQGGPTTQHIILDDLQKQMNWFKSQIEKKS